MCMLRQWCSLSMLHRTCEYMHEGVRLGGLRMPHGWCTLHMPIYFNPGVLITTLSHIWHKLLEIQQDKKSTNYLSRQVWDGSSVSTKGMVKATDKGL